MPLKIYNTLSKQKEEFQPINEGRVGIYVCGPTVYGDSHIGHAKSYVSFDVIVRFLRFAGYSVTYVQNITDVGHLTDDADDGDDKILEQAKRERIQPMAVVEQYMRSYFDDMDKLNILRPDISPRASGHIVEQIEIIKALIAKEHAYEADGSVYFDVSSFKEYGKLSRRSLDEMISGTRIGSKTGKKHPADFALWKKAGPGHIMRWQSPWGEGYPGWHIECSAMAMKYLGEEIDIHGGGIENQFPHHECEIAQSESATGRRFVKYWMHNNMVTVDGVKMGKSLGNFITLKSAFETVHPLVVRFFILQSHYRSPLDFSAEALNAARKGYERLLQAIEQLGKLLESDCRGPDVPIDVTGFRDALRSAMEDDFNTAQTVATLFDLAREANHYMHDGKVYSTESWSNVETLFRDYADRILAIVPEKFERARSRDGELDAMLVELLIDIRTAARKEKNFALSDLIRDRLKDMGIVLEDTREGTSWKQS